MTIPAMEAVERLREGNARFAPTCAWPPSQLRHGWAVLERLRRDDGLLVVGAGYSLETGEVDFFEGVPTAD